MKSRGTAIGGGASDRSPSVDLSAPRRMRGDDEGTMHDDGRPRKSTGRHDGGSDLEMPTALTIGGQSVECQIDCEAANCTEKWWEAAYPALYSTAGQCISPLPYITTVIKRRLGCEYPCATRELVSSQSLRDALAGNAGRFWAAGRAHCSRRSSITV